MSDLPRKALYQDEENGNLFWDTTSKPFQPICATHKVRLVKHISDNQIEAMRYFQTRKPEMMCPKDEEKFYLHGKNLNNATSYIQDKISKKYENMPIVAIEENRYVFAKRKEENIDERYKIEIKLTEDKETQEVKQATIYVFDRQADNNYTQLFADLEHEKLTFDHTNVHPKNLISKVAIDFKASSSEVKTKR